MKLRFLMAVAVSFLTIAGSASADIWVNELHYDNAGGDSGEFLEVVVAPSMSATDLSSVTLSLYNGSNGTVYNSETLDNFTVGDLVDGFQFYSWQPSSIQNGAPDGWSLDAGGTVLEFLSYEGTLTATAGAANGLTSTDIGVFEPSNTPIGQSLQLTGSGASSSDFTWAAPATNTSGSINSGQSFIAVPEPSSMGALALAGLVFLRRKRS
jgi:hypothetical protein